MNNEYYRKIAGALQQMNEKKKLDPVDDKELKGKHADRDDKDIDNDGDVDSSDEYLHNRRATIKKKMKTSKSGKLGGHVKEAADEMDECPECGGSTENHEADCSRADGAKKRKLDDDLDAKSAGKAMKHDCATHVASESWGYGECISGQHTLVEQEDGTAIVTHYDVMFEHGIEENVPVEDLTILREKSHMHASKQYMDRGKGKMAHDGANKAATDAKARIKARAAKRAGMKEMKEDDSYHAHHAAKKAAGGKTSGPDYDKHMDSEMKKRGYKRTDYMGSGANRYAKEEVVQSEGKTYAERTKGAAPSEPRLNKFKRSYNDGMEKSKVNKMVSDLKGDNPETKLDGEAIEKEKPSSMKQSPARNGDQRKGDLKPVKQGAK